MGITDILSLLGGLALFLYGMHMMSNGPGGCCRKQNEVDFRKADIQPF